MDVLGGFLQEFITQWYTNKIKGGVTMAKSIDEMAKIECCSDVDIAYFKYGANAVLEEIESCYDKDDSLCVIAHKIQSKITELKGE